jgi:hypothetical protein
MSKNLRIVALTGFPTALVAVVACGSILNINDRELDTQGGVDGAPPVGDGGSTIDGEIILEPAEASIPPLQGSKCDDQCATNGGTCIDRGAAGKVCQFVCPKACQFTCPTGNDCEVDCEKKDSCKDTTCTGGHSCTFLCRGDTACERAACASEVCRFECNGPSDACKESSCGALTKDCSFVCSGKQACASLKGIGSTSCSIDCTGDTSCGGPKNSCVGGNTRISCTGPGKDTCKGAPFCQPTVLQTCTINCAVKEGCKYCCDTGAGGACKFEGNISDGTKNCN